MFHHSENHKELNGPVAGDSHLEALIRRHEELEIRLATFKNNPVAPEDEIKSMKRQKLQLLDKIFHASA